MNFINEQWKLGKILTEDYVKEYRKNKSKLKNRIPKLPTNGIRQQVFEKSWSAYLFELKKEKFRNRIKFLDWARELLLNKKFNEINPDIRKAIAGFGKSQSEEFGVDIGCFGTTDARGYFKQTVNENQKLLQKHFQKFL